MEPALNKAVNLEDMLIEDSSRALPDKSAESGCPRHKQITWLNLTSRIYLALEVIELL